jgi:ParB family transcriptional regulator, chromosome partitioning protein
MKIISKQTQEIDLHRIQLRFAEVRIKAPATWHSLLVSMGNVGQKVPVIVVPNQEAEGFILIDGYLRVRALKHYGRDTVQAEIWQCELQQGLLCLLAGLQHRAWEAIEEAYLFKTLMTEHGMTLQELSSDLGRSKSFISRRLKLLDGHHEAIREAIISGKLSPWAACRILSPLARANALHIMKLLQHLPNQSYSTRQWQQFYQHYQTSNQAIRERMVTHPDLFFESIKEQATARQQLLLTQGPEGEWQQKLSLIRHTLKRLEQLLAIVLCHQQAKEQRQPLLTHVERCASHFDRFYSQVRRFIDDPH